MRIRRVLLALFLLTCGLSVHASSPTFESLRLQAVQAVLDSHFEDVLQYTEQMQEIDPETFESGDFSLLEARAQQRLGLDSGALDSYQSILDRGSILSDLALKDMSEIHRALHQTEEEVASLVLLIRRSNDRSQVTEARERLAQLFRLTGRHQDAVNVLKRALEGASGAAERRRFRFELGQTSLEMGQKAEAWSHFRELVADGSGDDQSFQALKILEQLESELQGLPRTGFSELFARSEILYGNREYGEAARGFRRCYRTWPQHPKATEAEYMEGRALHRADNREEARSVFAGLAARDDAEPYRDRSLFQIANSLNGEGAVDGVVVTFTRLLRDYPKSRLADEAMLSLSHYYAQSDETHRSLGLASDLYKKAQSTEVRRRALLEFLYLGRAGAMDSEWDRWLDEVLTGPLKNDPAALLGAAEVAISGNLRDKAYSCLKRVLTTAPNTFEGVVGRLRLQLLLVDDEQASMERKGLIREAREELDKGNPDGARKALHRVLSQFPSELDDKEVLKTLRKAYEDLSSYKDLYEQVERWTTEELMIAGDVLSQLPTDRARALLRLGFFGETADEILETNKKRRVRSEAFLLSLLYDLAGRTHDSIRWAEMLAEGLPSDVEFRCLPDAYQRLLYPYPYSELIQTFSQSRQVPPYLLLALIREESRFDPRAKSVSAARGLTQFIPPTAARIARQAGLTPLSYEDLYEPEVAINLGTLYLRNLLDLFEGSAYPVLAAYNAGEDVAARWLSRSDPDHPEEILHEIEYDETYLYVRKVMKSYWRYRQVYGPEEIELEASSEYSDKKRTGGTSTRTNPSVQ